MKKVIIGIQFLLIICSVQLLGQKNVLNIGIEGGTNLTFLHGNTTNLPSNPAPGFVGGVSFQYGLSKRIAIKTGINFERRITTTPVLLTGTNGTSDGTTPYSSRFDYVILPLMGKISWESKGKFYYINAGPHLGYLFRKTRYLDATFDDTTSYNNFDIGLSIGAGSMFPINKNLYLTVEARNNLGLRDMLNTEQSVKTNAISLLAGVAYRL